MKQTNCQACEFDFKAGSFQTNRFKHTCGKDMPKEKTDWKAEFDRKFLEPNNSLMRAMTLNNELCVMGTGKEVKSFIETLLAEQKKQIEQLIVDEILVAQKEGTPTSRLTSLAMKIKSL